MIQLKYKVMEGLLGPSVMKYQDISMELTKQMLNTAKPQREGLESPMQELGLVFGKDDSNDINELRQILGEVLKYPSSELAQIHMKANRIGEVDLKQSQSGQFQEFLKNMGNPKICSCCGFFMQSNTIGICTDIQDVGHMGISTFLYFQTIKNIVALLTIMFLILSLYSIISNAIASDEYKKSTATALLIPKFVSFQGVLAISLGSKLIHEADGDRISYNIQCWLGVAVIGIWLIIFAVIKHRERTKAAEVDQQSKSAADFTILIKNFPEGMTKQQLEQQIESYKTQLMDKNYLHFSMKREIKINKINKAKPFYLEEDSFQDDQLEQLNQQYEQYRLKYIKWIEERQQNMKFGVSEEERRKTMKQFIEIKQRRKERYREIAVGKIKELKNKETEGTVPAFVTFENSHNKQFIDFMHDDLKNFLNYLPCGTKSKYFHFKKEGNQQVLAQIRSAPEPEDIIWTNLGQTYSDLVKKKLFTYFISILVLGASFGAIYGLSKVQFDYAKINADSSSNQYISILISLCISIINIILQQTLRFLTKLQRSSTNTQHQTSLAIKAVLALLINSIAIPILVNYFFKENLYGVNGLAYDVFYLGITNSFLSPILKIFDVYYYFTRLWRRFKNRPNQKLYLNQNQLNTISQYMQFQIGYQYIYIVNLYLFTCFFAPLQPIIVLFAILGLILMFWAQKYSLFNRCQRPFPGRKLLNSAMYQIIYFGPAFYSIGSFCWSHFFVQNFIGIAPNLVAAILSAIILVLPYNKVAKIFFDEAPEPDRSFYSQRIFMPSQYDRLNPHTSQEGIQSYKKYLTKFKEQINNKNPQQARDFERQFMRQYGNGIKRQNLILPSVVTYLTPKNGGAYSENQLIMQQLFGTNQNVINPFIIGHALMNNQNQLNIPIQNWLTNEESQAVTYVENNNQNNNQNNTGAFAFNMTNSTYLPQNGELVTYQTKPVQNDNGNIKIIYDGLLGTINQPTSGTHLPRMSQPNQRNSIEVPLNVPINIFQMLGKLDQNPMGTSKKPANERFQTNNMANGNRGNFENRNNFLPPVNVPRNNGNVFDQLVQGNNGFQKQPYDPYSINLHSDEGLAGPFPPANQFNPYNQNPMQHNQFKGHYGSNPYGNGRN